MRPFAAPKGAAGVEELLQVVRTATVLGGNVSDITRIQADHPGVWRVRFESEDGLKTKVEIKNGVAELLETKRSHRDQGRAGVGIDELGTAMLTVFDAYPGSLVTEVRLDTHSRTPIRIELEGAVAREVRLNSTLEIVEMKIND